MKARTKNQPIQTEAGLLPEILRKPDDFLHE